MSGIAITATYYSHHKNDGTRHTIWDQRYAINTTIRAGRNPRNQTRFELIAVWTKHRVATWALGLELRSGNKFSAAVESFVSRRTSMVELNSAAWCSVNMISSKMNLRLALMPLFPYCTHCSELDKVTYVKIEWYWDQPLKETASKTDAVLISTLSKRKSSKFYLSTLNTSLVISIATIR